MRASTRWVAAGAVSLAYFVIALPPWLPAIASTAEPDESWVLALHSFFRNRVTFGDDVVFTFGPLGFAYTEYYFPGTYGALLAVRLVLAGALWLALFDIARSTLPPLAATALLLATGVSLASGAAVEGTVFALALALVVGRFHSRMSPTARAVTIVALATAVLVKFSFFMMAAVVIGAVTVDDVIRRRVPRDAALFVLVLGALWMLCGQRPLALVPYVRGSLELSSGYAAAMSVVGPPDEVVSLIAVATLLVACSVALASRTSAASRVVPVAAIGALLFLLLKASIVRQDGHVVIAGTAFLVAGLVHLVLLWDGGRARQVLGLVTAGATIVLAAVLSNRHLGGLAANARHTVHAIPARVTAIASLPRSATRFRAAFAAGLAEIRDENPLPQSTSTTDVYPWQAAVPIAYGMPYAPRPVFQSYAAYTGRLSAMNAAHLVGPRAPESLLFDVRAADGRFPALDDAASWPEILSRYDLVDASGPFLVLRRAAVARRYELEPIVAATIGPGESLAVPEVGAPIWARVTFAPSTEDRLVTVLFRSPPRQIAVSLRDGSTRLFRVLPSVAEGGFLLSPLIEDRGAFTSLALATAKDGTEMGDVLDRRSVIALRTVPDAGGSPQRTARVELSALRVERQPRADVPGTEHLLALERLVLAGTAGTPPELWVGPHGQGVVLALAPSTLTLQPAPGASRLHVEFGMLKGSWTGDGRTDGVEFRISVAERVLWSRRLEPAARPEDRGPQSADIDLPAGQAGSVALVTLPGADGRWDWSYWAAADVE